jgi:hypothetical protein
MSNKYPKGHAMNNPDVGTEAPSKLKKRQPTPPQVAMKTSNTQYAASGKKMMASKYYSGGGTVYTGR